MDLNEATREVTALSLSELQRSGVILRHEFADDLPPVVGDRIQLQQVILNLLRNAADAMSTVDDRPRELLITTEPDERESGSAKRERCWGRIRRLKRRAKSSRRSIRPKATAWESGSPSAAPSLRLIRDVSGRPRTMGPDLHFRLPFPADPEGWADRETRINRADSSTDAA